VEELLRKHRLLALGRASLGSRLGLLRRIVQLDAHNPVWQDDIREFERARLQQMSNNLDLLVQRNHLAALTAASEELTKNRWLVPPPAALVTKIDAAVRRLTQTRR
jgi:hypothetical protein